MEAMEPSGRPRGAYRASIFTGDYPIQRVAFGMICAADMVSRHVDPAIVRDRLAEPFDLFDHAGNFAVSACFGLVAARIAGGVMTRFEASPRAMKRVAIATGTLVVAAANALTETKWGVRFTGILTTPDPIDFAYGVGAGVLASSLVDFQPATNPAYEQLTTPLSQSTDSAIE